MPPRSGNEPVCPPIAPLFLLPIDYSPTQTAQQIYPHLIWSGLRVPKVPCCEPRRRSSSLQLNLVARCSHRASQPQRWQTAMAEMQTNLLLAWLVGWLRHRQYCSRRSGDLSAGRSSSSTQDWPLAPPSRKGFPQQGRISATSDHPASWDGMLPSILPKPSTHPQPAFSWLSRPVNSDRCWLNLVMDSLLMQAVLQAVLQVLAVSPPHRMKSNQATLGPAAKSQLPCQCACAKTNERLMID